MKLTKKEVDGFVAGYMKLCAQHQMYLVIEDEVWLQGAGEQLDIDEAVEIFREKVEISNV